MPHTVDGIGYLPYDPHETNPPLWAIWRCDDLEPWKLAPAHVPTSTDEVDLDFDVIIDAADADDGGVEVGGIWADRGRAEAAIRAKEAGK